MLSAKKSTVPLDPPRNFQRQLEHLYARRNAIDSLIASLQQYHRYKTVARVRGGQSKSS